VLDVTAAIMKRGLGERRRRRAFYVFGIEESIRDLRHGSKGQNREVIAAGEHTVLVGASAADADQRVAGTSSIPG
jgi:hypothetical protein